MAISKPQYEQGPIRPPSEANSLLLRLTRNCPWNRCLFCPVYKGKKFSRRSPEEIIDDIDAMAEAAGRVREISEAHGYGGAVNRSVVALVHGQYPDLLPIAFWLYQGGETVFLQDGDSLNLPVDQLVEALEHLKEKFPAVNRITTYARSRTLVRRSVEDLTRLAGAGLNRIHVGLESGSDRVLSLMEKGVTASQQIEAGKKVRAAGISLSEYVLLGLGGREYWREHALETARVINEINPDFIRIRTLAFHRAAPLADKVARGEFLPQDDDGTVRELKLFIENLEGIGSAFYSDHILNLLEEISGKLPGDKKRMLDIIDRYLAMPPRRRELFRIGRRSGYFRALEDMDNSAIFETVEDIHRQVEAKGLSIEEYIDGLMRRFV